MRGARDKAKGAEFEMESRMRGANCPIGSNDLQPKSAREGDERKRKTPTQDKAHFKEEEGCSHPAYPFALERNNFVGRLFSQKDEKKNNLLGTCYSFLYQSEGWLEIWLEIHLVGKRIL